MSAAFPTTASQMISFDDLALEAGAGAEILQYLEAKRINKVATLALVAVDQASFERFVVQPLVDGVEINSVKHQLSPDDRPVGTAILLHMWLEARRQWTTFSAASTAPTPAPSPPSSGTPATMAQPGLSAVDGGDERAPKTFPQWRQQIERSNEVLLGGRRRRFPERQLMGAESVLARLWHEHTRTKLYTPLGLGEILARRTFTASGELNPLVLGKNSSTASSNQALYASWDRSSSRPTTPNGPSVPHGPPRRHRGLQVGVDPRRHRRGLWAGSDRGPPSSMLIGTTGSCADGTWPWT